MVGFCLVWSLFFVFTVVENNSCGCFMLLVKCILEIFLYFPLNTYSSYFFWPWSWCNIMICNGAFFSSLAVGVWYLLFSWMKVLTFMNGRWCFPYTSWKQWTLLQAKQIQQRSMFKSSLSITTSFGLWGLWPMTVLLSIWRRFCHPGASDFEYDM